MKKVLCPGLKLLRHSFEGVASAWLFYDALEFLVLLQCFLLIVQQVNFNPATNLANASSPQGKDLEGMTKTRWRCGPFLFRGR